MTDADVEPAVNDGVVVVDGELVGEGVSLTLDVRLGGRGAVCDPEADDDAVRETPALSVKEGELVSDAMPVTLGDSVTVWDSVSDIDAERVPLTVAVTLAVPVMEIEDELASEALIPTEAVKLQVGDDDSVSEADVDVDPVRDAGTVELTVDEIDASDEMVTDALQVALKVAL